MCNATPWPNKKGVALRIATPKVNKKGVATISRWIDDFWRLMICEHAFNFEVNSSNSKSSKTIIHSGVLKLRKFVTISVLSTIKIQTFQNFPPMECQKWSNTLLDPVYISRVGSTHKFRVRPICTNLLVQKWITDRRPD